MKWQKFLLLAGTLCPLALSMTRCIKLKSKFFAGHPCAEAVATGTSYDMDDPKWFDTNNSENRDVCAYKFFAAMFMLGYNTNGNAGTKPHLRVLKKFKADHGLPASSFVDEETLKKLDELVLALEPKLAAMAATFMLVDKMKPLHPNDVSKETVAAIYGLAMSSLPPQLKMSLLETALCINVQCVGGLEDLDGNGISTAAIKAGADYRYVAAYFDPKVTNARLPSATMHLATVLHEFRHYIDGQGTQFPDQPVKSSVVTRDFYVFNYDQSSFSSCAARLTEDPKDWISSYGYGGSVPCPPGQAHISEEWAESFSAYVTNGKPFNAARAGSNWMNRKYLYLRFLFHGVEFDTDLVRAMESGCNDIPGTENAQPGYISCNLDYVWDWTLPIK